MKSKMPLIRSAKAPALASADPEVEGQTGHSTGHGKLMMLCCAAMFAVFGFVVYTAPAAQTWSSTLLSALPLLVCIGAHLFMHKVMGRSCHGAKDQAAEINTSPEVTNKPRVGI